MRAFCMATDVKKASGSSPQKRTAQARQHYRKPWAAESVLGGNAPLGPWFEKRAATIGSAALLGLCELIFVAAASNYITMRSAGVSLLFGMATLFIAALTLAAFYVGALKGREEGGSLASNAKYGAALGAASGAIVCALAVLFTIAGIGPERAVERMAMQSGILEAAVSYVSLLIRIFMVYLALGAAAGALAGFFSKRKTPPAYPAILLRKMAGKKKPLR